MEAGVVPSKLSDWVVEAVKPQGSHGSYKPSLNPASTTIFSSCFDTLHVLHLVAG